MLHINPLSVISFANIFSHSVGCLFILLMVSSLCRNFLVSCALNCLFLLLLLLLLVSNPKNYCQDQYQGAFSLMFSSRRLYVFVSYVHVFNSFCGGFCVWYKIMIQFHSLAYCPVLPKSFIEDTVLYP